MTNTNLATPTIVCSGNPAGNPPLVSLALSSLVSQANLFECILLNQKFMIKVF